MTIKNDKYFNNGIFEMYQQDEKFYMHSLLTEDDARNIMFKCKEELPKLKEKILCKINVLIEDFKNINPLLLIVRMAQLELYLSLNAFSEHEIEKEVVYLGYAIRYLQSIMASCADLDYTKELSEEQFYNSKNRMIELLELYQEKYVLIKYLARNDGANNKDEISLKMYLEILDNVTGIRYQCFHKQYFETLLLAQNELVVDEYGISAIEIIDGLEKYNKFLSIGFNDSLEVMHKSFDDFQNSGCLDIEEFNNSIVNKNEIDDALNVLFGESYFDFGKISKFPKKLLDDLSFSIGEERKFSENPDAYFPEKVLPINIKPLIKIHDCYYSFCSRTLYDKFYRVLYKALTKSDVNKKQIWNDNQKMATETNIPKLICERFGFTECYTNNYYFDIDRDGSKRRAENDAIILYENKLLIIEVKAGAISTSAIYEDFQSYENNFNEIFNKGIKQGERLIDLLATQDVNIYDEKRNIKLTIPKTSSDNTFVINVTIDDMNEITAHFEKTKYATYSKSHNCFCISLSDLLVYLDYFEDKISFFHFLSKRCKSLTTEKIKLNDELDHLGMYIRHNDYTMYSSTFDADTMHWDGYRVELDTYYTKKYNIDGMIKPKQKLPKRISEIINFLNVNTNNYNNSIDIACKILDLCSDAKNELGINIEKLIIKPDKKALFMQGNELSYSFVVKTEKDNIDMTEIDRHIYATMIPTKEQSRLLFLLEYSSGILINLLYKEYHFSDLSLKGFKKCDKIKDIIISKRIQKSKVGRNDPCPCGSGKKYKKCCLGEYN